MLLRCAEANGWSEVGIWQGHLYSIGGPKPIMGNEDLELEPLVKMCTANSGDVVTEGYCRSEPINNVPSDGTNTDFVFMYSTRLHSAKLL